MSTQRLFNFSAGPAVLPASVLLEAQRDLVALPGVGMSVLEISHRSKTFEAILARTEADLRTLGGMPANYKVLFLQGGAQPAVLDGADEPADRRRAPPTTSSPAAGREKAVKEAKRVGTVHVAGSTKAENFARIPRQAELTLTPGAAYVHITTNNTIDGTEWHGRAGGRRRAARADTSSDMFSRPIDVAKYGLIYAGAQKNLGPVGRDARHHPRGSAGALGRSRCRRC